MFPFVPSFWFRIQLGDRRGYREFKYFQIAEQGSPDQLFDPRISDIENGFNQILT